MGLDIHTYTNIQRLSPEEEKAILEHPDGPHEGAYHQGCAYPDINPHFPGREEGVEAVPYKFDGDWHFRAGSYSGHSQFRERLCTLLGLGKHRAWLEEVATSATHGPLEEFLNFSDCEGVIGPVVSTKLAKDFAELEPKAKEYAMELEAKGFMEMGFPEEAAIKKAQEDFGSLHSLMAGTFFWETYQNWKKAFTDAAGNGFVRFG